MLKRHVTIGVVIIVVIGLLAVAVFGRRALSWLKGHLARPLPASSEPITSDGSYTNIVFLHHSIGRNLIREANVRARFREKGYEFWDHDYNTIGLTRPDGTLTGTSYEIPEITPDTRGGGNTDPDGLAVLFAQPVHNPPDNAFSRLLQHEVLIVKSCFPNSAIRSAEELEQNKKWYLEMRSTFDQHPNKVFIVMTSPPLHPGKTMPADAARARALAGWLSSAEYLGERPNVFVFDFFDLLADTETNALRSEYQRDPEETDSHPNQLANEVLGPIFVDFVDTAITAYRAQH